MNYIFCLNISVPLRALPVTADAEPLQCALGPEVSGEFVYLGTGVGSNVTYSGASWFCTLGAFPIFEIAEVINERHIRLSY